MEVVKQALKLSTPNRRIFLESQRVLKGQILRGDMVMASSAELPFVQSIRFLPRKGKRPL
jgi:hypothetical protein